MRYGVSIPNAKAPGVLVVTPRKTPMVGDETEEGSDYVQVSILDPSEILSLNGEDGNGSLSAWLSKNKAGTAALNGCGG